MTDELPQGARCAPATRRNRDAILAVLRRHAPMTGQALQIAAGTGEHAVHFARAFPDLTWRPTDPDPEARASIAAWRSAQGSPNLQEPLPLDAAHPDTWPVRAADLVVAINMIHISPWAATEGLMRGAAAILPPGGILYLYGPYLEAEVETAPSNTAFDQSLKARDPAWGLRDLGEVTRQAEANGLERIARVEMPANNLSVVFRRG
jgi:hypothetical protein